MEFAVLSQSHKLAASWLAQPNCFFRFFLLWVLRVYAPETGVCLDFWVIGETMIYTDWAGQAWVRGLRMTEEALGNPSGGGWFNLSRGNSNQTRNEIWYGEGNRRKRFQTNVHLIFHWNVRRTHAPPFPPLFIPAVPVCRDHNGFWFSLS